MTEIQNPKPMTLSIVGIKTGKIPEYFFRSFWSLSIGPPKAERFICNLVLVIWNF